jgi:PAS domain S-box-containing protein
LDKNHQAIHNPEPSLSQNEVMIMIRPQSTHTILIADANNRNIMALKSILTPEYDIEVTVDGIEIIRLASSPTPPGLILINSNLISADDYEVCRTLKGDRTTMDIPIIGLAEPTAEDVEAKGFEMGVADYLTTPFKPSVARARIQTHLELRRLRDDLEHRVKFQVSELHEEIQDRRDVEDTYRALVEHARDGIVIIYDFKVKFANPAFCQLIGLSEKELIGAHLKKFISEEDFTFIAKRYSDRIAGINLPRIYKSRVIHSGGSAIDVEFNFCVIPYGRSLAALVFVRDIREEEAWKYLI